MRKFGRMTAFVILVFFLLVGCSSGKEKANSDEKSNEETGEKITITIGTQPWIGYGPWWIAEQKGIFEKYNIEAKFTNFIQDSDLNAAFASDNIQMANIATHTGLKMIANNDIDLKIITFLDESLSADAIVTKSEYQSLEDLKGKKIAFEEGTTSDILFRQAVSDHHLSVDDFEIVYMPASDAGLALLSNKVDAAVTYEPYISSIMEKDSNIHIIYSGENSPGLISDIAAVKADFLNENPELVKTLQQIWDEALKAWEEDQNSGNEIIAKESGTEVDQLPPILEGIHFFNMDEQREMVKSGELLTKINNIQAILKSQGGLDRDVDGEEIIAIE